MEDTHTCMREGSELITQQSNEDVAHPRSVLMLWQQIRQRSSINNAQGGGDRQHAAAPRDGAKSRRDGDGLLAQRRDGGGAIVPQIEQSTTENRAGFGRVGDQRGNVADVGQVQWIQCLPLRRQIPAAGLRLAAIITRNLRSQPAAPACGGRGGDLLEGVVVHVLFVSRRAAAVKQMK